MLDPDVVRHADHRVEAPGRLRVVHGARAVAEGALALSLIPDVRPAIVNGAAGIVGLDPDGRVISVIGFMVTRGKIVEMDILLDPARLSRLDVSGLVD